MGIGYGRSISVAIRGDLVCRLVADFQARIFRCIGLLFPLKGALFSGMR